MAANWRNVRVLISSISPDIHAEREHLVAVVFPQLCRSVHSPCVLLWW
jgi:hypothetical protein